MQTPNFWTEVLLDSPMSDYYNPFIEPTVGQQGSGLCRGYEGARYMNTVEEFTSCTSVQKLAEANLPTEFGVFRIIGFKNTRTDEDFIALVKGELLPTRPSLVRIHSQCLTGDVFHSIKCDCGPQLHFALRKIEEEGHGVIIYQQQEGRGIGIINKIRAYALQDAGLDTVEANLSLGFDPDLRSYECCAEIIKLLGLRKIRIMSNNPEKIAAVKNAGLEVVERVSIQMDDRESYAYYLKTKKEKMGHILEIIQEEGG